MLNRRQWSLMLMSIKCRLKKLFVNGWRLMKTCGNPGYRIKLSLQHFRLTKPPGQPGVFYSNTFDTVGWANLTQSYKQQNPKFEVYKLNLYTDFSGNAISISKPPYIANGRNPGKSVRSRTRNYISIAYALMVLRALSPRSNLEWVHIVYIVCLTTGSGNQLLINLRKTILPLAVLDKCYQYRHRNIYISIYFGRLLVYNVRRVYYIV